MSSRDLSKEDNFQVSGYNLKKMKEELTFSWPNLRFPQVRARSVITRKFKI